MEDITLWWLLHSWLSIIFDDIINLLLSAQKHRLDFRKKQDEAVKENRNSPGVNNF